MTTRTVWRGLPHQEDTYNATHENASPNIGGCRRCRLRNACPDALGTGKGAGIHWYWGTGLPRTGGRRACAGDRHATSCRRGPATGGIWICAGRGWRILRTPASPLETPSPPLAPLVRIPRLDAALPCRVDREGLFYLRSEQYKEEVWRIKRKVKAEGWHDPVQTDKSLLMYISA
jgi:hypothetical protein